MDNDFISSNGRKGEGLRLSEQEMARQQTALYQLIDRMHRADSLEEVYSTALDSILSALGCDRASLLLFDEKDVMRFVAWRGLSDGYRQSTTGHSPWSKDTKEPVPIMVADASEADFSPELRQAIEAEGIAALGFIPLVSDGSLIGKFMVYYNSPHEFTSEEANLALAIGQQLASGIERKRAQEDLIASEQRLRLALEAGGMGAWEWKIDSQWLIWSPAMEAICGFEAGTFPGTFGAYLERVYEEDRPYVQSVIQDSLENRDQHEILHRIVRLDGCVRWLEGRGRVIRDHKGKPVRMVGVGIDVTQRMETEQELREADRRKDTFLATLAHELRNPLAPMGYALQIMELAEGDRQALRNARTTMDRQLGHLVRLVDDLLDVSRITQDKIRLQKARVELDSIFQQAIEATGPLLSGNRHSLEVRLPEEPVYLYADSTRLAQVFSNLLNNSSKFTNSGGNIWISAERQGRDVMVTMRDNGIGISPEALPTVFDMFAQADQPMERPQAGLGIGLTLAKRLVELHDGSIAVKSEGLGKGCEFQVRLPLLAELAEDDRPSNGKPEAMRLDSRRILVVDDNHDAARLLSKMLEMLGHETQLAFDGPTALAIADGFMPDIILMDIGLPGMNGYEVAESMRGRAWGRDATLIAITGWGQEEDRAMSKQAGFDHHLVKPVSFDTLSDLLAKRTHPGLAATPSLQFDA